MNSAITDAVKPKMKTIYGIRTRYSDNEPWGDASYYKSKSRRDKVTSLNRIIGSIRTHSFRERVTAGKAEEMCTD